MTIKLLAPLVVLFSTLASADEFNVAGEAINIPAPEGYIRATDAMPGVMVMANKIVDPVNDTLAVYIPESQKTAAKMGEIPAIRDFLVLKVNKQLRSYYMSNEDFAIHKEAVKSLNADVQRKVESKIPQFIEDFSAGRTAEFTFDSAIALDQVIPLQPHNDTVDMLAYSMALPLATSEASKTDYTFLPATATLVNTSGALLLLYGYGDENQLEHTRAVTSGWANQILNSNITPIAVESEKVGPLNWFKIFDRILLGAIFGGILALVVDQVLKRKKYLSRELRQSTSA